MFYLNKKFEFIYPLGLSTIVVCVLLFPWLNMPIYPDEIAYRMILTRYIPDNGIIYSNWFLCSLSGDLTYPSLLVPVAYFMSMLDFKIGYETARLVAIASMILIVYAVMTFSHFQGKFKIVLFILGAFVGVSGSGMILMRPEAIHILYLGVCCSVFVNINLCEKSLKFVLFSILVLLFLWLSVYTHPQGILFAPVAIYLLVLINRLQNKKFLYFSLLFVFAVVYSKYAWKQLDCSEYPAIQAYLDRMISPLPRASFDEIKNIFLEKLVLYVDKFTYKNQYDVQYLPNISELNQFVRCVNKLVTFVVLIGILSGIFIIFALPVAYMYYSIKNRSLGLWFIRREFYCLNLSFLIAAPALILLMFDGQSAFYRAFFVNTCFYIALSLVLPLLNSCRIRVIQTFVILIYVITISTVVTSGILNLIYFSRPIAGGYVGPSISYKTDWKLNSKIINQLMFDFSQGVPKGPIVVDDATYLAMNRYPMLLPITYLIQQSELLGIPFHSALKLAKVELIIVRCSSLGGLQLNQQNRLGDFCILRP